MCKIPCNSRDLITIAACMPFILIQHMRLRIGRAVANRLRCYRLIARGRRSNGSCNAQFAICKMRCPIWLGLGLGLDKGQGSG